MTGQNGGPSDAELLAWAPRPAPSSTQPPALTLPGYSDFRLVAEGGEGTVYRARQDGLGRFVAVKVLNVGDQERLARFRRELDITVRLGRQHPHIVTVIDTGTAPDGRPCIVMEYYDLGSLHDRLREHGPLPVEDVVAAGIAVADALAFAHGQGFLHRDVKPQNILVLPTSYVLADFGIARMADAANTSSLQLVSYRHAAPQMIDGAEPSAADDLWSLGSTLFTLLDGAPPFATSSPDEDTVLSYLGRVRSAEPRPLRRADIPPELTAVITRCLSKSRVDRYPDATALRSALSAVDTAVLGWTPALPVADFGPRPEAAAAEPASAARPAEDADRTAAGPGSDLAGLTVRLPDERTTRPEFGPSHGSSAPSGRQPVAPHAGAPLDPDPSGQDGEGEDTRPPPIWVPDITERHGAVVLPAPRPRLGRRALFLAVAAIILGAAIGVGSTLLRGQSEDAGQRPPGATPAAPPSSPASQGGDPAFAPTLDTVVDNGDTITLLWSDPTGGKAQFVVVDVTGSRRTALATVAAGVTTYLVGDLDPQSTQYCFQIIAIGLDDPATQRGSSARTCTTR